MYIKGWPCRNEERYSHWGHNIADACEAKFGKKSRDASHPSYWDIKKV